MITNLNKWKQNKSIVESNEKPLLLTIKDDKVETVDSNDYEIESIIDIVKAEDMKKYENAVSQSDPNMSFFNKSVKENDIIYLTVMLKPRNNSTVNAQGEIGIAKCKITQIFYGTTKLNQLMKQGKIYK